MTKLIAALAVCFFALQPLSVQAQTRPATHWSTFAKQASLCACKLFARDAMRAEGLQVIDDGGPVVIAQSNAAIATAVCLPGEREIFLSASSSETTLAERIRNDVRARIVRAALFDTCP